MFHQYQILRMLFRFHMKLQYLGELCILSNISFVIMHYILISLILNACSSLLDIVCNCVVKFPLKVKFKCNIIQQVA